MIEYKIREVTRYIVTRWEGEKVNGLQNVNINQMVGYNGPVNQKLSDPPKPSRSTQHGEFDNANIAYGVAYALAKAEAENLGYPPGDDRIQYPEPPKGVTGEGMRF